MIFNDVPISYSEATMDAEHFYEVYATNLI